MDKVLAFHEFASHRNAILANIDAAVPLLSLPPSERRQGLASSRWRMVRLLFAYQAFKERAVFDQALRTGSALEVRMATRIHDECAAMKEGFRAYCLRWSSTDVIGEWTDYRPAMLAMVDGLLTHLDKEHKAIATLLEGLPERGHAELRRR